MEAVTCQTNINTKSDYDQVVKKYWRDLNLAIAW